MATNSIPSQDTSSGTALAKADERYQLTQLKEKLAEALGDDGPSYWNALRDFVQGKLNRQEFDFYAYMYLPGNKSALHNQFILATIHNAQTGQAPPEGESDKGFERRKRGHGETQDDDKAHRHGKRSIKAMLEDPKWRYIKELIKSMNKGERRAIKLLLRKPDITPEKAQEAIRAMKPVVLPMPASQLPQSYAMDIAKGITAPLVYDTKATPDAESLNYRMVAIALEQGLAGGVTRESGELLLYALDCHLKNIVSNMIYKIRSNRALGIPVSSATIDDLPEGGQPQAHSSPAIGRPTIGGLRLRDRLYHSKTTLRLSDLVFSLEISPNATVEPPLCLERCGNLLANQELAERNDDGGEDAATDVFASGAASGVADGTNTATAVDRFGGVSMDEDDQKHRRKIRRLRARYERWFGPYVSVEYSGNSKQSKDA
ncbi:hypothetical protein FBU59_004643 [Linderina macrospora]|uniref:Uncharacterized protein n=1 Tax=Linderina macrospora TaxID=4868 RepID=A0ACC1J555_9FUNG|nr:hypothetical protein FBU59_004643 [Linderina macrospora]